MNENSLADFSFDNEEKEKESILSIQEEGVEVRQYDCHNCNASFCSLNMDDISNCIICGDWNIEKKDFFLSENLIYVPFFKTRDEVLSLYKKKVLLNPLIPIAFKRKRALNSIQKVYLPGLLTNINQSGDVEFLARDKRVYKENKRNKLEIKEYLVVQNISFNYKNAFFNPSSKVPEHVFLNVCNCSFNFLKELDSNFKDDFLYLIEDISVPDMREKANNYISKNTLSVLLKNVIHPLKKLKNDSSTIQFEDTKKVLVPVYLLNMQYHKKNYYFIMNGENGHFSFSLPIGILETFLFSIISFIIIFLIAYLFAIIL